MAVDALEHYQLARREVWRRYDGLGIAYKISLAILMAGIVGLLAQVRIMLPWTPVPITGQTFGVLLAAVLLGNGWGGLSIALYAGLGLAGVPWFAGWEGGIGRLVGPTGGYILGFTAAALFLGFVTGKHAAARSFKGLLASMFVADFVLIFGPGLLQLYAWSALVTGTQVGLYQLLAMGLLPFVVGEVIKIVACAGVASALLSKTR